MAKKQATKTAAQKLLEFATERAKTAANWMDVHNAIFGNGGKLVQLFPTEKERLAFAKTPEFKQVSDLASISKGLKADKGESDQASGKFVLRLPASMHAALVAEAEAEGVSLNQLCMAKLAVQLRSILK